MEILGLTKSTVRKADNSGRIEVLAKVMCLEKGKIEKIFSRKKYVLQRKKKSKTFLHFYLTKKCLLFSSEKDQCLNLIPYSKNTTF